MTKSLQQLLIDAYQGKKLVKVANADKWSAATHTKIEKHYGQTIEWVTVGTFADEIEIRFGMQSGEILYFDYDQEITVE